jgi:hypothetical protein
MSRMHRLIIVVMLGGMEAYCGGPCQEGISIMNAKELDHQNYLSTEPFHHAITSNNKEYTTQNLHISKRIVKL